MTTPTVNRQEIIEKLAKLGLPGGSKILVHSTLSRFGHVQGGADTVIDALLEAVGPTGTVLMPTLTGHDGLSASNPPVFDPVYSPCWTGQIPEAFRLRPQAMRSVHPTHSVAAVGPHAETLTADHINAVTPCDGHSPYRKLAAQPDGYILLMGVTHEANTTLHAVEEMVGVNYHMQPGFIRCALIINSEKIYRHYMLHAHGTPRHFDALDLILTEREIQRQATIGNAVVRLVHAGRMVDLAAQALRADNTLLCTRPAVAGVG